MAQTATEIRGWLLQQPRAAKLRVITTDDQHHEVAVSSGVSWMAIAQSIVALGPALVEAYDGEGKILRAMRPLEQGHDVSSATPLPLALPASTDPSAVMLVHFSDLLAAAYRHSTDVAFERLSSLFEQATKRAEALERIVESMHRASLRRIDQLEAEEQAPAKNVLEEMVGGFLTAATHPNGNAAANGTNGKGA